MWRSVTGNLLILSCDSRFGNDREPCSSPFNYQHFRLKATAHSYLLIGFGLRVCTYAGDLADGQLRPWINSNSGCGAQRKEFAPRLPTMSLGLTKSLRHASFKMCDWRRDSE